MAEAIAAEKKWNSMSCLSIDVFKLLEEVEKSKDDESDDRMWLENALVQVRLSKGFDMLANTSRAYCRAEKGFKMIQKLIKIRGSEYEILLAPFYYKMADTLTAHIEIASDELGNIKPITLEEGDESEDTENFLKEEGKEEEIPGEAQQEKPIPTAPSEDNEEEPQLIYTNKVATPEQVPEPEEEPEKAEEIADDAQGFFASTL